MSRIAYVNGRYVPHAEAAVHIEDRGYQFADGVYEVVAIINGRMIDEEPHLDRLERSLAELDIPWPVSRRALKLVLREVVRRNRVRSGIVYFQITRGVAPRKHEYAPGMQSTLVITTRSMPHLAGTDAPAGVDVITVPDIRWKRCDIKSVSLLPNILAKQKAAGQGAYEAWQVGDDGTVTEGTASNAWIVTRDGELLTREASASILNGITRRRLIEIAKEKGVRFVERPFTVDEVKNAREAFLTSSSSFVKPVTRIDGQSIGNGAMGEVTEALLDYYRAFLHGDEDAAGRAAAQ